MNPFSVKVFTLCQQVGQKSVITYIVNLTTKLRPARLTVSLSCLHVGWIFREMEILVDEQGHVIEDSVHETASLLFRAAVNYFGK